MGACGRVYNRGQPRMNMYIDTWLRRRSTSSLAPFKERLGVLLQFVLGVRDALCELRLWRHRPDGHSLRADTCSVGQPPR